MARLTSAPPVAAGINNAYKSEEAAQTEPNIDLDQGDAGEEDDAGASSVVNFSLLSPPALMRYVKHYEIDVPAVCDKARLVRAVEEHFSLQAVDEVRPPVPRTTIDCQMTWRRDGGALPPVAALPGFGGARTSHLGRSRCIRAPSLSMRPSPLSAGGPPSPFRTTAGPPRRHTVASSPSRAVCRRARS